MAITNIVFDLGNVLIPFDYNRLLKNLNAVDPGLGLRFYNRYKDNYHIHRSYEKWELNEDEFLVIMTDWTENKIGKEDFCRIYSDLFEENKEVSALLPKLKKSYGLILLSNTNYIHRKYGWQKYEFLKYFDKLILSHEVGSIKPEAEIYEAVMDFTGAPPEEHLFIDDIAEYVQGAKDVGWNAVQFINARKLTADLSSLGIVIE